MPHISEDEYKVMDSVRDFCQASDTLHVSLKPNEKKNFCLGDLNGEVALIRTETAMYGWGGCGNNLGTQVVIRLTYRQEGKTFEEEIALGPRPQITKKGPFRLVGAGNDDGSATISIAL